MKQPPFLGEVSFNAAAGTEAPNKPSLQCIQRPALPSSIVNVE